MFGVSCECFGGPCLCPVETVLKLGLSFAFLFFGQGLAVYTRLVSNSQGSAHLCLPNSGMKGAPHRPPLPLKCWGERRAPPYPATYFLL